MVYGVGFFWVLFCRGCFGLFLVFFCALLFVCFGFGLVWLCVWVFFVVWVFGLRLGGLSCFMFVYGGFLWSGFWCLWLCLWFVAWFVVGFRWGRLMVLFDGCRGVFFAGGLMGLAVCVFVFLDVCFFF